MAHSVTDDAIHNGAAHSATHNGAARWDAREKKSILRSPRVLPGQGLDDHSVVRAIVVFSVAWSVLTVAGLLSLYGFYRLLRARARRAKI